MSAPAPSLKPTRLDPQAVRIVLFGMPDAGKTSLLGALVQAAQVQGRRLRGHLTDLTGGLADLRNRVYDGAPDDRKHEVVAYPVQYSPGARTASGGDPMVLFDCDGRAADQILTEKQELANRKAGLIGETLLTADAIVLTVDASAPVEQMDGDFREFMRFLDKLEDKRIRDHVIGGIPIFLVLNKCDLLAREPVTRAEWERRVEARKQFVAERFREYLVGESGGMFSFGTIDLHVGATSIGRPELTDAVAHRREPFGVAELFEEVFEDALAYRRRNDRSVSRLKWTVVGAGGFLGILAILGGIFLTDPGAAPTSSVLGGRVDMIQSTEPQTTVARLGSASLERRLKDLVEIKGHADFAKLPEAQQTYVRIRIEESQAYLKLRDDISAVTAPTKARSLGELTQVEERLKKLAVPAEYQEAWASTDAVTALDRMRIKEIPALRDGVNRLTLHYFAVKNRASALSVQTADLTPEWEQSVRELTVDAEKRLPFPKSDPTYGTAYKFDETALAEADWSKARLRLTQLSDVATALGMLGDGSKAHLVLTDPPTGADVAEWSGKRWRQFKSACPDYGSWNPADIPDSLRPEIQRRLKRSVDQTIRDGGRMILDKLKEINPTGTELPADWPRAAEHLMSIRLQDWRELTTFLHRLHDPVAPDPVAETVTFLRRPTFDLEFKRVNLRIPDTLGDGTVRLGTELSLVHKAVTGGEPRRIKLTHEGEPRRDKQAVVHTFVASGDSRVTFRPGDTLFAEAGVKKGDADWKLTWTGTRTASFQFERLSRAPMLHAASGPAQDGQRVDGVLFSVVEGKLPLVPPMIPVVVLERR